MAKTTSRRSRWIALSTRAVSLVCCCFMLISCGASLPDPVPAGTRAPMARITFIDGAYDSLASYRGKRVAVLFWAKWCSRSRSAIEDFHELAEQFSNSYYSSDVAFLAISLDKQEDEQKFLDYIRSQKLTKEIRHAYSGNGPDDEAAHLFQIYEIPRVVVISPTGMIELVTGDVDEVQESLSKASGGQIQMSALGANRKSSIIEYSNCETE